MFKKTTFLLLAALLLFGCGQYSSQSTNLGLISGEMVHIEDPVIENQNNTGFCWSYTTMGLIETLALQKGVAVNLSEEYIGYAHHLEQLLEALDSENPEAAMEDFGDGYFIDKIPALVIKYGVVPEDNYKIKFHVKMPEEIVKPFFINAFKDAEKVLAYKADKQLLINDLNTLFGITFPTPDTKFSFNGTEYTPKSFLNDYLKVDMSEMQTFTIGAKAFDDTYDYSLHLMKTALINKTPVPIGMAIFEEPGMESVSDDFCKTHECSIEYAHAMLIVDFKTSGGAYGEVDQATIDQVFMNQFKGFIVRNSWGAQGLTQEGEIGVSDDQIGYNLFNEDYLRATAKKYRTQIMIPKSIVDKAHLTYRKSTSGALVGPKVAFVGDKFVTEGKLLSLEEKNNSPVIKMVVSDIKNKTIKVINGAQLEMNFSKSGNYKVMMIVNKKVVASRSIQVFDQKKAIKALEKNLLLKTNNFASIDLNTQSVKFDTLDGQLRTDDNIATAEIGKVKLLANGRVHLRFKAPEQDQLNVSVQAKTNNGKKQPFVCKAQEDTQYLDCVYPMDGDVSVAEVIAVQFVGSLQPMEREKVKTLSTFSDISLNLVNGSFVTYQKQLYGQITANKGDIKNRNTIVDEELMFQTTAQNADSVRFYIDGTLVEEQESAELNSFNYKFENSGNYTVKAVAVVDQVESSELVWNVQVNQVQNGAGLALGATLVKSELTYNNEWFDIAQGKSAGELFGTKLLVLKNNTDYLSSLAIDISALKGQGKSIVLSVQYNLEQDYDYMYIGLSSDRGQTFPLRASLTGRSAGWKNIKINVDDFTSDIALISINVITDQGTKSKFAVIGGVEIK